jgi:hypothetical protein
MIKVQREFRARFRKDAKCVFSKPYTKLTLQNLFLLQRYLGNWPRGPAVSMRSELLVAYEKLGLLSLLTVYVVPV